jgi:Toxin SymE, type I toxin-antitoxin system
MKSSIRKLKIYKKYTAGSKVWPISLPRNSVETKTIPQIRLEGKWLSELGFKEGAPIAIQPDHKN